MGRPLICRSSRGRLDDAVQVMITAGGHRLKSDRAGTRGSAGLLSCGFLEGGPAERGSQGHPAARKPSRGKQCDNGHSVAWPNGFHASAVFSSPDT